MLETISRSSTVAPSVVAALVSVGALVGISLYGGSTPALRFCGSGLTAYIPNNSALSRTVSRSSAHTSFASSTLIQPRSKIKRGKLYLVGAGPGGREILTALAYQLIQEADILIVDDLVDKSILQLAGKACYLILVGKRGGKKDSLKQKDINQILLDTWDSTKVVVRLKGGDPSVFGRLLEELSALQSAEIPFEVVPGISSALAAPTFAGIPLTHPELSKTFVVLSGHNPTAIDWTAVAKMDTIVILMGTAKLTQIAQSLLSCDKCPSTPMAIIKEAGRHSQALYKGTLDGLPAKVAQEQLSPSIIIIGEVAKFSHWIP